MGLRRYYSCAFGECSKIRFSRSKISKNNKKWGWVRTDIIEPVLCVFLSATIDFANKVVYKARLLTVAVEPAEYWMHESAQSTSHG